MRQELDYIFRPSSVAVIGASTRKGTVGRETLHNILSAEFNGKVFPVNPKAPVIHSMKAYSTVLDVPDAVDLAIVIVPKPVVKDVVRQCGQKGVRGIIVISAGFSETGAEGKAAEEEVVAVCHEYGMRMIGPNCFGVVNTDPEVNLNATFGKTYPKVGNIGHITQSGAMGEAVMNQAKALGIGFSVIASIGNHADISVNDCLLYMKDDPRTDVILLYVENFGNPRHFTQIAREISRIKPIVAVKSGRTKLGAKAASSHTGALADLDVGVDALFEQTGIMRVDTVEELFDVAAALTASAGTERESGGGGHERRRAGSAGDRRGDQQWASDAGSFADDHQGTEEVYLGEGDDHNPMDMVAGARGREYKLTLEAVSKDENYDTIIPIFVPPKTIDQMDVATQYPCRACTRPRRPCWPVSWEPGKPRAGADFLNEQGIPVYIFPEAIAKTLATIWGYRSGWSVAGREVRRVSR